MTTPTTVKVQLKLRQDTASGWASVNPILLPGELGRESDTGKIKIGNGSTAWNSLSYQPFGALITNADISPTAEIAVSKLADGAARQLLQTDAAGTGVEWTNNVDIPGTLDVTGVATFDAAVTVAGDLTVNGTTTTISTQNLLVEDKNIIIGDVASPTDVTADGGGITLKGATDKTINWIDATDAWTSSERFSVPLGSASTPSLTFTGDTNTGIYSPGADQVAISTGGSGRLFVNASGNVGIGTTSPGYILDTFQSINTDAAVNITNSNAGTGAIAQFRASNGTNSTWFGIGGTGYNGYAQIRANGAAIYTSSAAGIGLSADNASGFISFGTGSGATERARIDSSGRLGVGVSSPAAKFQINVQDGFRFDVGANAYSYMQFGSAGAGEGTAEIGFERTSGKIFLKNTIGGSLTTFLTGDGSGRVGIGTTSPSAIVHSTVSSAGVVFRGSHNNSGIDLYANDATGEARITATRLGGSGGKFLSFYTDTGTGEFERARIDSSGRLLVGTSSARSNFFNSTVSSAVHIEASTNSGRFISLVNSGSGGGSGGGIILGASAGTNGLATGELGIISFQGNDGAEFVEGARIEAIVDGTSSANDMPGRLVFSTAPDSGSSPVERLRISRDGAAFLVANAAYTSCTVSSTQSAGTTYALFAGKHSATNGASDSGTASVFIYTNGNIANTNNSYGAISDVKLKENIVDATSQWSDIKALQVRKYNFKEGQTHTQIGLVAQEVELVSPGLVTESPDRDDEGNDLGTVTKSVNYSVLYMKAVKALQEAMERIEVLEQRLTDAGIA